MNNYKSFSELKEELGDNYDFKLYEMGISALKEIENLQQENKQLKMIINEYERLNKGFKITNVQEYNVDELLSYQKYKDNWNKLKEKVNEGMRIYRNKNYDLVFDIEEIPKEDLNDFISYLAFQVMEQLIINIEQGSDSNE